METVKTMKILYPMLVEHGLQLTSERTQMLKQYMSDKKRIIECYEQNATTEGLIRDTMEKLDEMDKKLFAAARNSKKFSWQLNKHIDRLKSSRAKIYQWSRRRRRQRRKSP